MFLRTEFGGTIPDELLQMGHILVREGRLAPVPYTGQQDIPAQYRLPLGRICRYDGAAVLENVLVAVHSVTGASDGARDAEYVVAAYYLAVLPLYIIDLHGPDITVVDIDENTTYSADSEHESMQQFRLFQPCEDRPLARSVNRWPYDIG